MYVIAIFVLFYQTESVLGIRHLQTALLFIAMVLIYGMRVNISMAIVAMTDRDDENVSWIYKEYIFGLIILY